MGCVNNKTDNKPITKTIQSKPSPNTPPKPLQNIQQSHQNNIQPSPSPSKSQQPGYIAIPTQVTFINQNAYPQQTIVPLTRGSAAAANDYSDDIKARMSQKQRKKQILQIYKIDKDDKIGTVPKINTYNYQTLLINNPNMVDMPQM